MNKHPKSKINIIIINWNEEKHTLECIKSLKNMISFNFEIETVLVDNGSEKDSFQRLKNKISKDVKIIRSEKNLGFTGGNNLGIKYALDKKSQYILLLNNDTIVEKDFLKKIIESLEQDKNIGIIGPKINYLENKKLIWCIGGKLNSRTGNNKLLWNKYLDKYNKEQLVDVGYVSGCAMCVRSEIFRKIGLLDDNYFLYNEESDFCLRAKRILNIRTVCRLDAKIYHKISLSSGKISGLTEYYLIRNRLYFVKKHNTKCAYLFFLIYFTIFILPTYTIYYPLRYKSLKILRYFYRGILDHFNHKYGKSNLF